jgi:tetratricopeptide (TPR) repeat protein
MSEFWGSLARALKASMRMAIVVAACLWSMAAFAQDKAQLLVTAEAGYGRLVISFPGRNELPVYKVKYDNGVLAVEFTEPVSLLLPDVAVALPDYISVARVDPDSRGVRFGLRTALNINHMEAGERLFLDLMPKSWQGLPPSLPPEVVADLAKRAKEAERIADQKRKADEAKRLNPIASLRVGRNPTFMRVEFSWNVDTKADFSVQGAAANVDFEWPVPVDLYQLKADLPEELKSVVNSVSADGSRVTFRVADGIVPRFYTSSPRQFVVDIDISREDGLAAAIEASEKAKAEAEAIKRAEAEKAAAAAVASGAHVDTGGPAHRQAALTPIISTVGSTVRVSFPFEDDTAAAVFRRGDTVWMLFDTSTSINAPKQTEALSSIATRFEVIPAGDTEVVRIDLSAERLATLGSEGRSWVLSLGDVLLNPTEPLTLTRMRDDQGHFEMLADLTRPAKVHQFRDPSVGDLLTVVTAYPPSRGAARNLNYVDFTALRSVHGLVVKPGNDALRVEIDGKNAVISTAEGLTLSPVEAVRPADAEIAATSRVGFVDLLAAKVDDPAAFVKRREETLSKAADAEGRLRDIARLELAELYIANQFGVEALGVLSVLDSELRTDDLRKKMRLLQAMANVLAYRSGEAMSILSASSYEDEVDTLLWRTIAKAEAGDYMGARLDAMASEGVVTSYPEWVQSRFLLAGVRAAVETKDTTMASRLIGSIQFAKLNEEQMSTYQLMQGRLAELEGRADEALDTYGQVITADIRPTRAEAVYRTLRVLEQAGRIDLAKATTTLAAEAMLWRGNQLEADMAKLLAELYFRDKRYRDGFEVVRQAVSYYPENKSINALLVEAQAQFGALYLDGAADQLGEVDALSLYYDFQQLTPPGSRGDEMIRNLARRMVKADLLSQAGDLLEYQIDNRLKGVAQSQIAADLAVVRIADRNPEAALRVLNRTRLADLSPLLERQRRILEARALIDAGREDLALDLLSRVSGRDADLLRVDGLWKSKNYARASELLEVVYAPGNNSGEMDKNSRMNIIKAAVGFVISGDSMGLSRLRSKFGDAMAQSAEWAMFDFVTGDITPASAEFRKVARQVADLDSLNAFLASYRQLYPDTATMTPASATPRESAA